MKKILYSLSFIPLIIAIWILYTFFFLRINEEKAKNRALGIIEWEYSNYCSGGFEKNLQIKINWYNEKYEFIADNWKCSIIIFMDEYGAYDLIKGPN